MAVCEECFALAAQWLPSPGQVEPEVWLRLGAATASALAINALQVNKPLKLLLVTGAVFAIAWNSGRGEANDAATMAEQTCVAPQLSMLDVAKPADDDSPIDAPELQSEADDAAVARSAFDRPSQP